MMTERVLSIQINDETHRALAGDHRGRWRPRRCEPLRRSSSLQADGSQTRSWRRPADLLRSRSGLRTTPI